MFIVIRPATWCLLFICFILKFGCPWLLLAESSEDEQATRYALQILVDKSRSMLQEARLDLAKEAITEVIFELSADDYFGLTAFDLTPFPFFRIQEIRDQRERASERLARLLPTGRANPHPALLYAYQELREIKAERRHVLLVTDGAIPDLDESYLQLVNDLRSDRITLSIVVIGSLEHVEALGSLAKNTGGRFYYTDDGTDLSSILLGDIQQSRQQLAPAMADEQGDFDNLAELADGQQQAISRDQHSVLVIIFLLLALIALLIPLILWFIFSDLSKARQKFKFLIQSLPYDMKKRSSAHYSFKFEKLYVEIKRSRPFYFFRQLHALSERLEKEGTDGNWNTPTPQKTFFITIPGIYNFEALISTNKSANSISNPAAATITEDDFCSAVTVLGMNPQALFNMLTPSARAALVDLFDHSITNILVQSQGVTLIFENNLIESGEKIRSLVQEDLIPRVLDLARTVTYDMRSAEIPPKPIIKKGALLLRTVTVILSTLTFIYFFSIPPFNSSSFPGDTVGIIIFSTLLVALPLLILGLFFIREDSEHLIKRFFITAATLGLLIGYHSPAISCHYFSTAIESQEDQLQSIAQHWGFFYQSYELQLASGRIFRVNPSFVEDLQESESITIVQRQCTGGFVCYQLVSAEGRLSTQPVLFDFLELPF